MLIATLCLQGSLLFAPLHLEEEPPELRSLQHILIVHDDVEGLARRPGRTAEQALELAADLERHLDGGADFGMLADRYSSGGPGAAILGSFVQGALAPELDRFLFTAELGAHSGPIETPGGVLLLQRIDTRAAVRAIRVDGLSDASRARAAEVARRLEAGEDFGALATELSDDKESAAREGRLSVFERGPRDVLLKAAAFDLRVGQWTGPIESPVGLHFLLREDPAGYEAALWESNFARLRTILIRHAVAEGGGSERSIEDARGLAQSLRGLLAEGRSFAELAANFDEDPGGKERAGDLGWVHRRSPGLPTFLSAAFLLEPGEWSEPRSTTLGFVIVQRER
ncbi:MAG: peptidylprolyl isomerase [Planctomycetes bacterium]|nr:peptidylprolyl isomerase [Planctomycetota bacterium]MCB9903418.1 peptidylprolyl isomerase [Planctomycetota bacterium]